MAPRMEKNRHIPRMLRISPTMAVALGRWPPNRPPTPVSTPIRPRKALLAPQTNKTVPPARSQPCWAPTNAHRPMPKTSAAEAMPRPRLVLPRVLLGRLVNGSAGHRLIHQLARSLPLNKGRANADRWLRAFHVRDNLRGVQR